MKVTGNIYFYPEVGIGDCNTYLIDDEVLTIIDPGRVMGKLKNLVRDGFDIKNIKLIVNTHSHGDHCGLNETLKTLSKAKIAMYKEEAQQLNISKQLAEYFSSEYPEFNVDFYVEDQLKIGKTSFKVIHTPGHSPGSICLYCEQLRVLFCGDLIFEGGVGRTDFPGGSSLQLKNSIELVSKLDVEYLLPGHMNPIAGKRRVEENFMLIKTYYFNLL